MTKEKILIADDEPFVLEVCKRILEKNYHIKIVRSGLEAIQITQHEHFDLLLTDIKMPGVDGLETAKEIKKINPDIVCITMTGFSTMETAIKALRLGVDEFVIKPFAPEELSLAIERALEKERLRKENIRLKSLLPLFEFNKSLMSTTATDLLLPQVLDLAVTETKSDGAVLYLRDTQGRLTQAAQTDIPPQRLETIENRCYTLVKHVEQSRLQLIFDNETETDQFGDVLTDLKIGSLIITPLLSKGNLIGILLLFKHTNLFTQSECNFLTVMAGQVAIAYQNARLFEDLRNAYEDLKTLDHMKSEFINIAAHELRTPLAILMGYASVLEEDATGTDKEHLGIILRNATRLRALINDLLDMRHIQTGQLDLNLADVDIESVINQVVIDMSVLAQDKNITIGTKLPEKLPVIRSDLQKIELIFTNLLGNAIKFTPPEGEVWISGRMHDDIVEIAVSDTGVGISEKEFPKIFQSFYQVENSLNREHDGIGLGLAIVEGMLKRCGGEIWVESTVGEGSTFTFTLPSKPLLKSKR